MFVLNVDDYDLQLFKTWNLVSFNKRWRRKDQSSIKNNKEALTYVCNSVKLSKLYYISTTIYSLVFLIIKNTPIWVWFHTSMQKKRGTRMCIILTMRIRKSLSTAARSFRASFCIEKKESSEKRLRTLHFIKDERGPYLSVQQICTPTTPARRSVRLHCWSD